MHGPSRYSSPEAKHAGENIAEVLKQRAHELPAPIQMCDALSRNTPKGIETLIAHCLAHGRRQVVEVVDHFPEEAGMFWRRWAASITTMPLRGNEHCRRKSGCTSIRS